MTDKTVNTAPGYSRRHQAIRDLIAVDGRDLSDFLYIVVRPKERRLPDEFFVQVADAYRKAAADDHNPRTRIATDSGYPDGTVSRWIRTARDKGFLEPSSLGKASGRPAICRKCGRPL